ncbi:MAG: helix-turn-helix domain-containing protein [Bacteroidota bacterium]
MPKQIGSLTLYSVDDLHEQLGLSKMTIRTYLREGKIRGRKLGVSWYVTEQALREYFDEPAPAAAQKKAAKSKEERPVRYVVQGINDLVSEKEECDSIEETIEVLEEQAIISLFQVAVVDRKNGNIIELIKARDFINQHT